MALTMMVTVPQSMALATDEVVEYSWEAGPLTTNWSKTATFPQFDPALGSLLDVTLELESEVTASMFVENTSTSSGCDAAMTWGGVVELDASDDHVMLDLTSQSAIDLAVFDGAADFAGSSGASFPDLGNAGTEGLVLDSAAAQIFVGAGTVDLGVLAHATAQVAGCGVIQELFITTASVAVNLSYRYVAGPAIDIEKATNGVDADVGPGPVVVEGDAVVWTYVVSNVGDVPLVDVVVTDDQGVAVLCPQDTLAVGESMTCTGSGVAELGQYGNVGAVAGTAPNGAVVTDEDPSHYYGATITWWVKCDHGDIGCLGIQGQVRGEVLVRVDGEPQGCEVDPGDGGEVRFNCMLDGASHPATVTVEVLADGHVIWIGEDLPTACTTTEEAGDGDDAGEVGVELEPRPRRKSRN